MELEMPQPKATDEEVAREVATRVMALDLIVGAMLCLEEQQYPGYAARIRVALDDALGRRSDRPVEPGWVKIRAYIGEVLERAEQAAAVAPRQPFRQALRKWLNGSFDRSKRQ